MTSQYRQLQAVYDSQAVTDGDGVKIQSSVTRGDCKPLTRFYYSMNFVPMTRQIILEVFPSTPIADLKPSLIC